jgi:hypothetical protein
MPINQGKRFKPIRRMILDGYSNEALKLALKIVLQFFFCGFLLAINRTQRR